MIGRTAITGLIVFVGTFVNQNEARAGSYQRVDALAVQLQAHATLLIHEFRRHYSHTPEYGHLQSDARAIAYHSGHIHELIDRSAGLHHIQNDLRALDRSFHHLEEVFDRIDFSAEHSGFGHTHGHTAHAHRLMNQLERTLHHLRTDIEALDNGHHVGHGVVIVPRIRRPITIVRPRNYGEIRSGWTVGLNTLDVRQRVVRGHSR